MIHARIHNMKIRVQKLYLSSCQCKSILRLVRFLHPTRQQQLLQAAPLWALRRLLELNIRQILPASTFKCTQWGNKRRLLLHNSLCQPLPPPMGPRFIRLNSQCLQSGALHFEKEINFYLSQFKLLKYVILSLISTHFNVH